MARFLVAVWPIPGHHYSNLTIASALRARGHDVAFLTGARAREAIEREGFECVTFRHVDERGLDRIFFQPQAPRPWWKPPIAVQRARSYDWLVGLLPGQVEDVEDAIARWNPDVILCDPALWGVFLVVPERSRIPVVIFAYVPYCFAPGPDIPPLGFGLPMSTGALGRLRIAAARLLFRLGTGRFRNAANRLRHTYHLAPIDVSATEFSLRMPLYLIAGTPELDFTRKDLPASVHYIGPCVWERPRSGPPPAWVHTRRRDQPWVYVSEGTIHTQQPIVSRAAAHGLADLPMQVVISTSVPGDGASLGLGEIAPNTQLEHWVNIHFVDILPLASVVVTTGGAGTVLASLAAGVPVVIIPTEWDKPDIAQRVVAAGAGLQLPPSACTPARLRVAVERVLHTPEFRQNAQRLARAFSGYGGPAEAARLLEDLALRSRTTAAV